jgi:formylglycine-generating enzyme required for sulfatase activity
MTNLAAIPTPMVKSERRSPGIALVAALSAIPAIFNCGGSTAPAISFPPDASSDGSGYVEGGGDSAGSDRDAGAPVCPQGRGPAMVALPTAAGGTYCVDSTEVTQAQYAAFLADKNGDLSGQPSQCSWNSSYQPGTAATNCDYAPSARGNYPIDCIDWCDAYAFCQWAGKSLCGDIEPTDAQDNALVNGAWPRACTSAGTYTYVYGNTSTPGACADSTHSNGSTVDASTLPVASLPTCQSPDPTYAGIFDLLGNVSEWSAYCNGGQCIVLGGDITVLPVQCFEPLGLLAGPPQSQYRFLGFRCCAP